MKKKLIFRCLLGASVGLSISTIITIIISFTIGDGKFYPVVPELITDCGNELNAMVLQSICSLLYGAAWSGAAAIWEKEDWSLLRQTILHLILCSAATFPIAYFMRWIPHNITGFTLYFSIFFGIYLFIWFSQYFTIKKRIRQINEKVRESSLEHR